MKFSLKWLGDFVDVKKFTKKPEVLAQALTQVGLEVEAVEDQKTRFKHVFTAKIESAEQHPQADRLRVCKVSTGAKTHNIICGSKNFKAGDHAILAVPGAVLPGDFPIKKRSIRGVESEGMLASREELGFNKQDDGIWILPKGAKVGQSFAEYLGADITFDIAVPPNRSDCLSHMGLAREISCLFSLAFSVKKHDLKGEPAVSVKKSLKAEVKDSQSCPRYCGRLIEGVKIGESSPWLKDRLRSLGLKSINNVVDVTNFVLWDRGQPLHAFDRDKIQTLTVDKSRKGEKFLALDDSELTLTGEELTIRDKDRVLALAGVIGGMDSAVTEKSQNIFLESAYFAPENIRKTVRRLGLETDSSYRFTRGIDFTAVQEAMDWACFLIQKEAGGKVSADLYDICKKKISHSEIEIQLEDLEERLGYAVPSSRFETWMKNLGCKLKSSKKAFHVLPPSYRTDLNIKEDLIEETARLEGYDKIPERLAILPSAPADSDPRFVNSRKLISFLKGRGWCQALNYSFCDPEHYKDVLSDKMYMEDLVRHFPAQVDKNGSNGRSVFSLNNPISSQLSLMKPLLAPDLIKNAVSNFRRNNKFGQIFELAPVFYQKGKAYKQNLHLGLAGWGNPIDVWTEKEVPHVYSLKSVLESVFESFRIKGYIWKPSGVSFLHPRQTLFLLVQNKVVGFVGSLHPQLLRKYKLPVDMALAEVKWETLTQQEQKPLKFKSFSQLLTVEKDLCFVVPPHKEVGEVQREIKKSLGNLCDGVEVFDLYEKEGERSVSFRMFLQPEDKSWTDEQLNSFLNKAIESVQKKLSIHLK